jgi:hypothetical protein
MPLEGAAAAHLHSKFLQARQRFPTTSDAGCRPLQRPHWQSDVAEPSALPSRKRKRRKSEKVKKN